MEVVMGMSLRLARASSTLAFLISVAWSLQPLQAEIRPTPREWEQWQPETDNADVRLAQRRVSVWTQEITVEDLCARLSEESGVSLCAEKALQGARLTAFLRERELGATMVLLAALFDGYWSFPRGSAGSARSYCLTLYEVPDESLEEREDRLSEEYKRADAAAARPARESRLSAYESGLSLSPAELLKRYEADDPWVCANLLDPALRPMIGWVCGLDEAAKEGLFATGDMTLPIEKLDPALRDHLGRWARGEWSLPAYACADPDPDRLSRFSTPDDRWARATATLHWADNCLQLLLEVPDVARFDAWAIRMPQQPYLARRALAQLGYREDTPEYRAAAEEEGTEWQERHPEEASASAAGGWSATASAPQGHRDARLESPISLGDSPDATLSVAQVLELAARECGLNVLAHYQPIDRVRLRPAHAGQVTLQSALDEICRQLGRYSSWKLYGEVLLLKDGLYWWYDAAELPREVLARGASDLKPGSSLTLDELADLIASLNGPQSDHLARQFPVLQEVPHLSVSDLRLYALLGPSQRAKALTPGGVRVGDLGEQQQRAILRYSRARRPWMRRPDISEAILRAIPRKLAAGGDGISLTIEYKSSGGPVDRDVVFTAPVTISFRPRQ